MKKNYVLGLFILATTFSFAQNGPVDFEPGGFGESWTWTCFENDINPQLEIVANPDPTGLNNSATVAKFTALQAGNPWAGCETMHGADVGTFNINASNNIIRIMVYKTKISDVGIKLVTSTAASLGEILVPNTKINEWEQLTFDFSAHIGGMTYDQLVVFPDFVARGSDDIIYFDNIFGEESFLNTDELTQNDLTIYPNPTSGMIYLKSDSPYDNIEVFSMAGQKLIRTENALSVDMNNLEFGVYILRAEQNGVLSSKRVIKK